MASRTVLVIDDDHDTCASYADVLSDLGYEVDVAHDGPGAMELVNRKAYRLALVDLRLPGTTGVELFRRMREVDEEIAAFLVTAYATTEAIDAALAAGMRRVLNKPLEFPFC